MTLPRPVRLALILSPTVALVLAAVWFVAVPSRSSVATPPDTPAGKLVVLVVFDQMRGDYLDRWASAFGPDGFERMKVDGVWYANARLPYACTSTGPGHASIATGAPPSVHGIVENSWFLRDREKAVNCASGDEPYRRVPPPDRPPSPPEPGLSPVQLLCPTVTDALAAGTDKKGRVFSLSLKGRSAVLLGGKEPAGAYCFDDRDGRFHTSAYYRDTAPPWVEAFNRSPVADTWLGKSWERLLPPDRYESLAGPDAVAGEGRTDGPDQVFPHVLPGRESDRNYYSALETSPFGNDLLWRFARTAIVEEELGRKGVPDLLCLAFSSNDLVGHRFGPDSHEVLDITARSDRLIAEMLTFLDGRLGRDKYSLVVTADHGVCPLPEVAVKTHPTARRTNPGEFVAGLDEALDEAFGKLGGTAKWVERSFRASWPWVYLNRQSIRAAGVNEDEVEKYAEQWIGNRPGVQLAVGRKQLMAGGEADELLRSIRLAYHPDRCGDVYVLPPAFVLIDGNTSRGTNHGSPHDYDRHVPVLAVGAGVPRLGRRDEAVNSLVVTPLVCKLLGVAPPPAAKERVPAELSR